MGDYDVLTPLVADDSPLDAEARSLVDELNQRKARQPSTWFTPDMVARRKRVEVTTWEEMQGQPEAIAETLQAEREAISELAKALTARPIERMYIVGCGDSWYSALGVRALFEELLGVPCEPMQALDFGYYYNKVANERTLVLSLSSSGSTPRTVEAMLMAQARGAQSVALTNTAGSPMEEAAEHSLLVHAVRNGWPTQASTAAMAMMSQLGIDMARRKGVGEDKVAGLEAQLHETPELVAGALKAHNDAVLEAAESEAGRHVYLFAGGGPAYACAMFGAAKIKEMTPDYAYALPQEEYHHFHSQKAGDPLFVIAPRGPSVPRAVQTAVRGKGWGGQVYGVITEGGSPLKEHVDVAFELPEMDELLVPIVYTVPVQLFAYHVGMAKFRRTGRSK